MAKSGTENPQTTEVIPFGAADRRLRPPPSLGEAESRAFIDLVHSLPANHFRAGDASLICRWCELTVMAEKAAEMLRVEGMVNARGTMSPWINVHAQMTKGLNMLALRLRLGPQSRVLKQSRKDVGPVSAYERLRQQNWKP
jgi:hypothetical protein